MRNSSTRKMSFKFDKKMIYNFNINNNLKFMLLNKIFLMFVYNINFLNICMLSEILELSSNIGKQKEETL